MIQASKCYSNCNADSLIQKKKEHHLLGSDLLATLETKLQALQSHYSKTEIESFRKIKELKAVLNERTLKQAALGTEVAFLREEFGQHQLEIAKLTEQMIAGTEQEIPQKKTSSPPALLKKSAEGHKLRLSPTTAPSNNTSSNKNINELNFSKQTGIKVVKKGQSPTNSSKKLVHMFPSNSTSGTENESGKVSIKTQHNTLIKKNHKQKDNQPKSPEQPKKKVYSPKSIQLKGLLLNSIKTFDKERTQAPVTNNSPKRLMRNSPTTKAKEYKKALGNLKESEAFEAF